MSDFPRSFYITTPIYYASGDPHVGHAYTTISADILSRYYRQFIGESNVYFLTGTDEHGLKIAKNAEAAGLSPQVYVDQIAEAYRQLWKDLNISHNDFIRTTEERHEKFVRFFVEKLKDNGYLYEAEYEGLYCVACEKFIAEKDLVDGKCPDHQRAPEKLTEKNWFFDLNGKHSGRNLLLEVKDLITSGELKILPEKMEKEVLGLLNQDLPDFSISRNKQNVKWGIPLPWDDNQLIYVWADALTNYLSAVDGGHWWPAQVQLLGKDILKFHAIFWPAMLLANDYALPKVIFSHGYFTVDGQKMSKTIGNVIDPVEMTNQYGSDVTRYLLSTNCPFGDDGDINREQFAEKYNAFFANHLGNYVNRILTLAHKYYEGKVPARDVNLEKDWQTQVDNAWLVYHQAAGRVELEKMIKVPTELIQSANEYITKLELWKMMKENPEQAAPHLYNLLEVLRHSALQLYPIIPEGASKILEALAASVDGHTAWGGLTSGQSLGQLGILYPRLENKQ
ncbi:MAG TPA: methionine--tRNA ligase [bacterium]|nr:methionine--tRNA ligase [bacterium]